METRVWPKDGYGVASGSNRFQFQQPPDFWRVNQARKVGSLLFLYGHNDEIDTVSKKTGNYFFVFFFFKEIVRIIFFFEKLE